MGGDQEKATHWDMNIVPSGSSITSHELHAVADDIRKGASPRVMEFTGNGELSCQG